MAYIKYKEITKYFNFEKEIAVDSLPKYVTDYIEEKEEVLGAYKNIRDYAVFTNCKIILFDKNPLATTKKVHVIPYISISTSAISFGAFKADILMSLDSGYPLRITFIKMNDAKKTNLKNIYKSMMKFKCNQK